MAIGLALSGGGFRASLFHLGVIRRLRAEGLLGEVGCIASVSGGSITAAHLLANWDKYNSSPEDFDSVAKELISLTKIDVRGRIQRRLPLLWLLAIIPFIPKRLRISPTNLLAKYYDRHLFRGVCAADVGGPKRPTLLILSTNLSKAGLTCFGRQSVRYVPFDDQTETTEIEANIIPLAQVVAASSAYPGFFPPILLSDSDVGAREGTLGKQYFTDAGVFDNLGLFGLRKGSLVSFDRVLVSDAGRSFVPQKETEFGILRTALRAVDIFMFRIRQLDLASNTGHPVTLISISQETDAAGAASLAVQSQLENVRTDLDKFSQLEITELMRHGYHVTAKVLASESDVSVPPAIPEWDIPVGPLAKTIPSHDIARTLQDSARRRLRLFSIGDWVSWAQVVVVTLTFVALITLSGRIIEGVDSVIAGIKAYPLTKYKLPDWTEPPPTSIETVAQIVRPENDGFEVVSDDRVWDLRQLQRTMLSSGVVAVTGSALLTRISTLIKHEPNANQYKYLYQTAASKFTAWSPKKNFAIKLLRSAQQTKSGDNLLNTYELQLDVSSVEVNKEFILEAQAKTIDAPWDRNNSWLGMSITDQLPAASMRIIFPKSLPYKRPVFLKYPNDSPLQAQSFDGIVLDSNMEKELLWRVDHPQPGWTYKVQWDWD